MECIAPVSPASDLPLSMTITTTFLAKKWYPWGSPSRRKLKKRAPKVVGNGEKQEPVYFSEQVSKPNHPSIRILISNTHLLVETNEAKLKQRWNSLFFSKFRKEPLMRVSLKSSSILGSNAHFTPQWGLQMCSQLAHPPLPQRIHPLAGCHIYLVDDTTIELSDDSERERTFCVVVC